MKGKKGAAPPLSTLIPSLPAAKECDSYSYNVASRVAALVGYSLCTILDGCLGCVRWITTDTGKLKKIQVVERVLLETHFSELNADRQQVAHGMTKVVRLIPFIRTPVTLLIDAAEKASNHNMKFLEKCSKVALSALSFIPKMACKACNGCASLLQKCIRYPRGYCRERLQNPDRLNGDISALFHRLGSFGYSIKRALSHPQYRTLEEVEQIARRSLVIGYEEPLLGEPFRGEEGFVESTSAGIGCGPQAYVEMAKIFASEELSKPFLDTENSIAWQHIFSSSHHHSAVGHGELPFRTALYPFRFFPSRHMEKTDGEKGVDRLEQKIGCHIVSQGAFYKGIQRIGERVSYLTSLVGKGIAIPFRRAGKKGRYDLKIVTALSLKSAELFFATDKGSVVAASLLEKAVPVPLLENFLQKRVRSLVHMPKKILDWIGIFHTHLKTVRQIPSLAGELKQSSEHSTREVAGFMDQLREFCMYKTSLAEGCSEGLFQMLNTTRSSLANLQQTALEQCLPLPLLQDIENRVKKIREATTLSSHLLDPVFRFLGLQSFHRKYDLIMKQRAALAASEQMLDRAYALQKLQAFHRSSPLLGSTAKALDTTLTFLFPLLQIQWVSDLWQRVSGLLFAYGAPVLKFSLLGYDMNEKLTETKKNLILSAQQVSQKALTQAERFVPQSSLVENRRWSWTLKVLKIALPATITLTTSKTATLTTKLLQIALPHMIASVNTEILRAASDYMGREIPFWATRIASSIKEMSYSLGRHVQARWNRVRELVDQKRIEGLQGLTLLERISLVELLQQSTHIPASIQSIVFDKRLRKQFFTMEERWNGTEWDSYGKALLMGYEKLTGEEKRHITPIFFLSLPEHIQARIRNCLKGSWARENYGDIEGLVSRFNVLPLSEKQKLDVLSVEEFLRMPAERQKDLLALLVIAKRGRSLAGHTLYEKFQAAKKLNREELEGFLAHFSTLCETDFDCLTPSQALRMPPQKFSHLIDLLHTYKRSCLDELAKSHGMVAWCSDWETLKKNLLIQLKKQREISSRSSSELPFAIRLARDIVDHIALLFSSLNVSERVELLSFTEQEVESLTGEEQGRLLALMQAHIDEWKGRGKASTVFSFYAEEKIEPCLAFLNACLKKLRSQQSEPQPSL